jgi:hypothetical protein
MKSLKNFLIGGLAAAIGIMTLAPARTEAQTISLVSTSNSLSKDTVTNTAVKKLVTVLKGYKATIGIQVDVTKISGTLGGALIPVASNDGVTYYPAGSSTFTVTDVASQGVLFNPPQGFAYYGVQWTGTGTMSGSIQAKLVARKTTD